MRIAQIIGKVTLSRSHESMQGTTYKLALPMTLDELRADQSDSDELLVVYDDLGAGQGSLIALSEGGEACQPFYPDLKPVDAYNAAILDRVDLRE
ncbi:MAG: EutN/CcmL family microcompartment protein [Pirellulaceae bacterium]